MIMLCSVKYHNIALIISFYHLLNFICLIKISITVSSELFDEIIMMTPSIRIAVMERRYHNNVAEIKNIRVCARKTEFFEINCRKRSFYYNKEDRILDGYLEIFENGLVVTEGFNNSIRARIEKSFNDFAVYQYNCKWTKFDEDEGKNETYSSATIRLTVYKCRIPEPRRRIYKKRQGTELTLYCPNVLRYHYDNDIAEWFADGRSLAIDNGENFLRLSRLDHSHVAVYYCLLPDSANSTTATVTAYDVRVSVRPDEFQDFEYTNITDSSAVISWRPRLAKKANQYGVLHDLEPKPKSYHIRCMNMFRPKILIAEKNVTVTENETKDIAVLILTDLEQFMLYQCRAQARNAMGNSAWVDVAFRTKPNQTDLEKINNDQHNFITARFGEKIVLKCGGSFFKSSNFPKDSRISIRWWRQVKVATDEATDEETDEERTIEIETSKNQQNHIIDPFLPDYSGNYNCRIEIRTPITPHDENTNTLEWPQSFVVIASNNTLIRTRFFNLNCSNYTESSITLNWDMANGMSSEDRVIRYKILFWKWIPKRNNVLQLDDSLIRKSIETTDNSNTVQISALSPDTAYEFFVVPISVGDKYGDAWKIRCATDTKWEWDV